MKTEPEILKQLSTLRSRLAEEQHKKKGHPLVINELMLRIAELCWVLGE